MNKETAHILNDLTRTFYERCAGSFSATRERPWRGWEKCLAVMRKDLPKDELSMLDIACGNLRFEEFVSQNLKVPLHVHAIDSCPRLLNEEIDVSFLEVDIVQALEDESLQVEIASIPSCDLVCAFGFFHHIPEPEQRLELLDLMLAKTEPGGFTMISLWQFEHDERMLEKAQKTTARARELYPHLELDQGDWLLGWQDVDDAFRYCHSFSDAEADELIAYARGAAELVMDFRADGKSNDLNRYLVFRKRA